LWIIGISIAIAAFLLIAQPASDPTIEGYRTTEVASVSDAMEQLLWPADIHVA
jgi:hypothetical protein